MRINELKQISREIWGKENLQLNQMIVVIGKIYGDICRWERNYKKDEIFHTNDELQKELGNIILVNILFCDELEYNLEESIKIAIESQLKFTDSQYKFINNEIMEIDNLLKIARNVWKEKMKLIDIIAIMGKVFGDICRWERNAPKDEHSDNRLQRALGNLIFSTIRWCDDLGFDPKECIKKAIYAQKKIINEI